MRQEGSGGPLSLSTKQIAALAGEFHRDLHKRFEDEPGKEEDWRLAMSLAGDQRDDDTALERTFGNQLDWLLNERLLVIDGPSRSELLRVVNRAFVKVAEVQARRAGGDFAPDPYVTMFPAYEAKGTNKGPKSEATDGVTLSNLFELWGAEHKRSGGSERTIGDFKVKIASLRDYLGHEIIGQITPRGLVEWTDYLQVEKGLAAKTVRDKYLAAVRAVLKTGVRKFLIEKDPSAGLLVKVCENEQLRTSGFTEAETKTILAAALNVMDEPSKMSKLNKLAILWGNRL